MNNEQIRARYAERARPSLPRRAAADNRAPIREGHAHLPRLAEYMREDRAAYILWDIAADHEVEVAKSRSTPDPFPTERRQPLPGALLLRLSGFALVGTLAGGAPGAALGLVIALVALVRLVAFRRRARVWTRRGGGAARSRRLPSVATAERLRLVTALGQSLLALVVGGALVALLLTALR